MSIGVIVELTFTPGSDGPAELMRIMSDRLPSVTRPYDGCEYIHLYVDPQDANRYLLVQRWESKAKYDAYRDWAMAQDDTRTLQDHLQQDMTISYLDDTGA